LPIANCQLLIANCQNRAIPLLISPRLSFSKKNLGGGEDYNE